MRKDAAHRVRIAKVHRSRDAPRPCPYCVIAGAIEYNDGSCGNLEVSSASPASCNSHFGYAVCVFPDERARIADAPTNPTAKPSSGVAQQQPSSAPGAFPQSVPSEKRRAEGISLNCACAIDKEEANPYSASRDITPAASTRVSYNWRNNPGSPNSEPLQVLSLPLHRPSASRPLHWGCCVAMRIHPCFVPSRSGGHAAVKRTADSLSFTLVADNRNGKHALH